MDEAARQVAALDSFVASGCHGIYGMRWGDPDNDAHLRAVRDSFLLANLSHRMTALEIGSGGGRWSRYFIGRTGRALLVDATPASEAAIRAHCPWPGFEFIVSTDGRLPSVATESVDFVFSFDTFVHFEAQLFDRYIAELGRVSKCGARFVFHYATCWDECEQNDVCFRYRDNALVEQLLYDAGFAPTYRDLPLRCGFGSIVREAIRSQR